MYNWEIRHHSLVCCCGFADILNILKLYRPSILGSSFGVSKMFTKDRLLLKKLAGGSAKVKRKGRENGTRENPRRLSTCPGSFPTKALARFLIYPRLSTVSSVAQATSRPY